MLFSAPSRKNIYGTIYIYIHTHIFSLQNPKSKETLRKLVNHLQVSLQKPVQWSTLHPGRAWPGVTPRGSDLQHHPSAYASALAC